MGEKTWKEVCQKTCQETRQETQEEEEEETPQKEEKGIEESQIQKMLESKDWQETIL